MSTLRTPLVAFSCALLLILFGILSYSAIRTKSAAIDEPVHLTGIFSSRFHSDYRIDSENPPLLGRWVALALKPNDLTLDLEDPLWKQVPRIWTAQWHFSTKTLYQTPGNDADAVLNRARFMCTLLGVALGALLALVSWRLGGPLASLVATSLFAFDPLILGHASLLYSDVPISLWMLLLGLLIYRAGNHLDWKALLGLGLVCGLAANTKFSGLLFVPMVAAALTIRALLPAPWPAFGRISTTRRGRLTLVGLSLIGCLFALFTVTWACYGFRYEPSSDPEIRLDFAEEVTYYKYAQSRLEIGEGPPVSTEMLEAQPTGPVLQSLFWLDRHRLLPHAWIHGFAYTYASTRVRASYLLGEFRETGWVLFFPLAMVFQTPTATLVGILFAGLWLLSRLPNRPKRSNPPGPLDRWTLISFLVPPILYSILAITSHFNLGLRHMLPVYPYLYLGLGCIAASAIRNRPRLGSTVSTVLCLLLAIESSLVYPHYLIFFNLPSGGIESGPLLLIPSHPGGQDLKLLARWQQENPAERLYLCNYSNIDPSYYGIDAIRLTGNAPSLSHDGTDPMQLIHSILRIKMPESPTLPGIVAVDLFSFLLFTHSPPNRFFRDLRQFRPMEKLGGTIYLYRYPLYLNQKIEPTTP